MKRFVLMALICVLGACSRIGSMDQETKEVKNTTMNCTSQNKEEYSFFAQGDEIKSMQEVFYMSFEEIGVDAQQDTEHIKNDINEKLSAKYASIPGVSAIVDEVVDNQIKVIFMIDFNVADMNQLVESGIIDESEGQNHYVSLEKTKETHEKNGFACEYK